MDDGGLCGNCNLGGIWDCSSSSSSMCSQGNQSAKQQSRPRVVEPEGHTQPDTSSTLERQKVHLKKQEDEDTLGLGHLKENTH